VPEGDEGFASLAKLGVKTIITVDGARPQLDLAHKYGMRYVHIPHGYDGIDAHTQALLAGASRTLPGPIFVHCHHGKHRGPAAAAVICLANGAWTPEQGEAWLRAAGTAAHYLGLYGAVRNFRPPPPEKLRSLPSDFPEAVEVSGLVEMMVEIDEHWGYLKAARQAGYQVPKENPDIDPVHQTVILWEHYREAQRLPESARHGEKFLGLLRSAETVAKETEGLLREWRADPQPAIRAQLDRNFDALAQSCSSCHKIYRDLPELPKTQ
jgi:hypothetical protein